MISKQYRLQLVYRFPRADAAAKILARRGRGQFLLPGQFLLIVAAICATLGVRAGESVQIPAIQSALASKVLLTDSARLSDRIVAVGAYGNIVYSRDGTEWVQANVPSQVLLTTVYFVDDREGWAAGHDTLILHTTDGGENWHIQYEDPIPGGDLPKPILDIYFADKLHGWAIGAFSLLLVTEDGGASWETVDTGDLYDRLEAAELEPEPNFNAFHRLGDGFLIVGELGALLYYRPDPDGASAVNRSDTEAVLDADDADGMADVEDQTWRIIASPYVGSFFGVNELTSGEILIHGLRGRIYRSLDVGATWAPVDTRGSIANINDIIELENGDAIAVGTGGALFRIKPGSVTAEPIPYAGFNGFVSVQQLGTDQLLLFGDAGAQLFSLE